MNDETRSSSKNHLQTAPWHQIHALGSDLAQYVGMLWRRKILIASLVSLVMAIAVVYVYRIPPTFTAMAVVLVEGQTSKIVNVQEVAQPLAVHRISVLSQVEVIRSRLLAETVIDRLGLMRSAEFNPQLAPPRPLFDLMDPISLAKTAIKAVVPKEWIETVRGGDLTELSATDSEERLRTQIVDTFLSRLTVRQRGFSSVIEIAFSSKNPSSAAHIANAVADAYIVSQLEAKFEKTRQATAWLNDRLTDLRAKVEMSERAVESFRGDNQLVGADGRRLTEQKITELNNQAILAQTDVAAAQARYQQVRRLLDRGEDIESAPEVVRSPLIQKLREQETEMLRNLANLSNRYGDNHPTMINARTELKDLNAKIGSEVRKIAQLLKNELDVTQSRFATIQAGIRDLERKAGIEGQVSVRLREMEREAQANRALYEAFLSRFKETSNQQDLQQADARIISRASMPLTASAPRKSLMLTATLLIALFSASGIAILIERLDRGLRGAELVESITGVPVIAMIPKVKVFGGRAKVADYIVEKPLSAPAEAIRNLETGIRLSAPNTPPQVICLTSALPGEGKTVASVWLARNLAMQGRKTLLVDLDLRRPRLHEVLALDCVHGIHSVARGEATWRECLRRDERTGADVLVAAPLEGKALEFVGSQKMREILAEMRAEYDVVIVDSPPMLAVSDSRIIAHLVDATVFVIKWDKTERGFVEAAIKQVRNAGIELVGVALSQVDTRKHARYGYRDYGTYYGKYRDYYSRA